MAPRTASSAVAMASSSAATALAASKRSAAAVAPLSSTLTPVVQQRTAGFSTTASRDNFSRARRRFRQWESTVGAHYKNYVEDVRYLKKPMAIDENKSTPFPNNTEFRSARVLDQQSRELIWERVMRQGQPIKAVSAEFGVELRRVGAVVRLMEIEKQWEKSGKSMAKPYAEAVLNMVPTHRIQVRNQGRPLESVNEVHNHPATRQQIFWPTSESREFKRSDASQVFHDNLLPMDKRLPIPELIQLEKDVIRSVPLVQASEKFKRAVRKSENTAAKKHMAKAKALEEATSRVQTDRFEFRFQHYNSENVGPTGRRREAVGARYGVPHRDRTKGEVKIPTSVP